MRCSDDDDVVVEVVVDYNDDMVDLGFRTLLVSIFFYLSSLFEVNLCDRLFLSKSTGEHFFVVHVFYY